MFCDERTCSSNLISELTASVLKMSPFIYLICVLPCYAIINNTIPGAQMVSESKAHNAEGRMGY